MRLSLSLPIRSRAAVALCALLLAAASLHRAHAEDVHANRLIDSNNPYLLMHAHNPVDWYAWGPEALEKARRENKPIFLSIGYSTCYWCHVAERTVFSNPQIAKLMNDWFVNIKVDREERPDLDAVYMLATQLITAGSGGWPNNLFLTPDLAPFYAGGYFPPEDDDNGRPGFAGILRSIHEEWEQQPERLRRRAQGFLAVLRQHQDKARAATAAAPDSEQWLARSRAAILERFDHDHGGSSRGRQTTKFPDSPALALMLADYRRNRTPHTLQFLTVTLDAMAYGGIYDQLAGGFHRYSTERTWSIPHFEKMLYDNAQLLSIYTQAWELTGRAQYKRIALGVRDFLRNQLMSEQGGFYTAQDAAVNGVEGASYLWTRNQIDAALGADAQRFFETYELVALNNEAPELDSEDVPSVLRVRLRGRPEEREARVAALGHARRKLRAIRDARAQPPVDQKVLVALNGLAIDAFVASARVFKRRDDIDVAERAAKRIWDLAWDDTTGTLKHELYRGRAQGEGFLDDYALAMRGLLALHTATKQPSWLRRAKSIGDAMLARFRSSESGVLSATANTRELLFAPVDEGDSAYPCGISAALDALSQLSHLTRAAQYRSAADAIAAQISGRPDRFPTAVVALSTLAADPRPDLPGATSAPPSSTAAHVQASGVARSTHDHDEIAVTLRIEAGYHVNANPASYDFLIPTALRIPGMTAARVRYPPAKLLNATFAREGVNVYEGDVDLVAQVAKGALAHAAAVRVIVEAQACTQTVCLAPSEIPVVVRVAGDSVTERR